MLLEPHDPLPSISGVLTTTGPERPIAGPVPRVPPAFLQDVIFNFIFVF